jgi:hypothetical protein
MIRYQHNILPPIISQGIKNKLAQKLELLYSGRYTKFLAVEMIPGDELITKLAESSGEEIKGMIDLSAAWKMWSYMCVHDRHFILDMFYRHMNILTCKKTCKGATAIFCNVFVAEFVPILSAHLN